MNILGKTSIPIIALILVYLLSVPSMASGKGLDDPIKEYSYHVKMDLTDIEPIAKRILDPSSIEKISPEGEQFLKMMYQYLMDTGIFDLKDVELNCVFDENKVNSTAVVKFNPTLSQRGVVRDFVYAQPKASVVRAMIPEEETLFWLTIMDPDLFFNMIERLLEKCAMMKDKGKMMDVHSETFMSMVKYLKSYMGDEIHFIIEKATISQFGAPEMHGAIVFQTSDTVTQDDLKKVPGILDNIFIENAGGEKATSKWHSYDVISYKNIGCPMKTEPSIIFDKNFFVMANNMEALENAASAVFTPARRAQSVLPPVMNGMMTFNMDKMMDLIPDEAFTMMSMMTDSGDPHKGNLRAMIDAEDWGMIRLIRTHTKDGVLMECSANRVLYSLVYHVSIESFIMGIKEQMKWSLREKEEPEEAEEAP